MTTRFLNSLMFSAAIVCSVGSVAEAANMNYLGGWSNAVIYKPGSVVIYNNGIYYSLKSTKPAPNKNYIPSTSPSWWQQVGTVGNTILNGPGNPFDQSLGQVGDFYLNTTTNTLFGPKTAIAPYWPAEGVALAGSGGEAGPQGPTGPAGTDGAIGPQGPAGADGAIGPQGPAGADGAIGPQGPKGDTGPNPPAILTLSVNCTGGENIQGAINSVVAGTDATINVSGQCSENIVIPYGKSITINGAGTASILAANPNQPVVRSKGRTVIIQMTISNTSGPGQPVLRADAGVLNVYGSDIVGSPSMGWTFVLGDNSKGEISNSRVSGGSYGSVILSSSALSVYADSDDPVGPDGYKTTIGTLGVDAIWCMSGGSAALWAAGATTGSIDLKGTIWTENCDLTLSGNQTNQSLISRGIELVNSNLIMDGVTSIGASVAARHSDVVVRSSTFTGNQLSDTGFNYIISMAGSRVTIDDRGNQNQFDLMSTGQIFGCTTNGQIYVKTNGVVLPVGYSLDNLVADNWGCPVIDIY